MNAIPKEMKTFKVQRNDYKQLTAHGQFYMFGMRHVVKENCPLERWLIAQPVTNTNKIDEPVGHPVKVVYGSMP